MTTDQMMHILNALAPASLIMKGQGEWSVSQPTINVRTADAPEKTNHVFGAGATPEKAIQDHWQKVALLPETAVVALEQPGRRLDRFVRWNSYMWADVAWKGAGKSE